MRISGNYRVWLTRAAAIVALVFGVATVRSGGSVLFALRIAVWILIALLAFRVLGRGAAMPAPMGTRD